MADSEARADKPVYVDSNARERVIVFLAFMTSEECRAACRKHAQPEALAATLVRLWFDEIYVPGDSTLDGLKPGVDPYDLARFNACFSSEELSILERFHGFFELRLNFLSNRLYGRAFFPENDSWHSLLQHATYVLGELAPDPDQLRKVLANLVQQLNRGKLMEALSRPLYITSRVSP